MEEISALCVENGHNENTSFSADNKNGIGSVSSADHGIVISPPASFKDRDDGLNNSVDDRSIVVNTTADESSDDSTIISDQDIRCNVALKGYVKPGIETPPSTKAPYRWPQISPLAVGVITSGTPILNPDNSDNAVIFEPQSKDGDHGTSAALTFNGKFNERPPHVIIEIESDSSFDQNASKVSKDVSLLTDKECSDDEDDNEAEDETEQVVEDEGEGVKVGDGPVVHNQSDRLIEYSNERSPDIFDDIEEFECGADGNKSSREAEIQQANDCNKETVVGDTTNAMIIKNRDTQLLKRLQTSLSGVLPPPSVTNVTVTVDMIVTKYREFEAGIAVPSVKLIPVNEHGGSIVQSRDTVKDAQTAEWPQLQHVICHDVYYNSTSAMELFEYLTVKYSNRFISADTSSSFVTADISSAKKRTMRTKALQQHSPGRRLSHLAKRRAIFSCANLQSVKDQQQPSTIIGTTKSDLNKIANRQILLIPRRKTKTPKRKTPHRRRTPGKRRTPSSSAKKRLSLIQEEPTMASQRPLSTRESSKRALFQSPAKNSSSAFNNVPRPKITPELANRVEKSKRALFASPKFGRYSTFSHPNESTAGGSSHLARASGRYNSMTSLATDLNVSGGTKSQKRRRSDSSDDDENDINSSTDENNVNHIKIRRIESPSKSSRNFMRSQSFTAEYLGRQQRAAGVCGSGVPLQRANSETIAVAAPLALTDSEKKKLLWIVSQVLQRNQVDSKHNKFKEFATVMAKVVKRLYLESSRNAVPASVSEQMAKWANKIAFQVVQGKTELEIYTAERLKSQHINNSRSSKLNGYITPADYELYKSNNSRLRRSSSSLFSENSTLTFSQSSLISNSGCQNENLSQSWSQQNFSAPGAGGLGIGTFNTVLRENVDSELRQRLSSQKNIVFSGKDQKNVSPYSGDGTKHSSNNNSKLLVGSKSLNLQKAKRQISFDA